MWIAVAVLLPVYLASFLFSFGAVRAHSRDDDPEIFKRDGASTASIAVELKISAGTVRNYLSDAILKLGAANRIEAARIARAKGWL